MKKTGFAEILDKWERCTKGSANSASAADSPAADSVANKILSDWLQNNEITDKDAEAEKTLIRRKNQKHLLSSRPDRILDVHGLTSGKAWLSLDIFFTNARNNGCKKLRIIHGKGNHSSGESVLRSTVQKYIEKCPFAGKSGYEKSANGGTGATWVLLK